MKANVEFLYGDRTLCARLSGEIDHHTAQGVREKIDGEFFSHLPSALQLDFSAVSFMDSSAIALIIGRHELVKRHCGALRLSGLSPSHKRLVTLAGIERLAGISIKE